MTLPVSPPATLDAWLEYIERLHHRPIDLGLERVREVAQRMGLALPGVRILVGGTNGKGSTCALLESILRAAGYRVARYGSPHLLRFHERALLDGLPVEDAELVPHLAAVEAARGAVSLTYFEFTTLAVFSWFSARQPDVSILEIGLGGRLDAVNIIDADCAIVTTVGLDHLELLGPTREHVGAEKAHIYRTGRPAICADPDPPAALTAHAAQIGADLWCLGRDFAAEPLAGAQRQWNYRGRGADRLALPWPALRGAHQLRNAAGALAVLESLAALLPVDQQAVRRGLAEVTLTGRFQVLPGRPSVVLDVGHNAHAAAALAEALASFAQGQGGGRTHAVFGMLRDKDPEAVVRAMAPVVQAWHLAGTSGERGMAGAELARRAFSGAREAPIQVHDGVAAALAAAQGEAHPDDRIIVFGSFVVVADALRWLERSAR